MMTMTTTSPLMVSSTNSNSTTTTPTSVSRAKDISTIPTTATNDDDSLLSKSLGHYNPAQGTNMPRGSYHDIKSRYFMSLNLSSPHNTTPKTPPQQTSPSLPNSSGMNTSSGSLLTNNINRSQRTSSLSAQIGRQTSPGQKPDSRERRQTSYDFNKHSEAIPIPSKVAAVPVAAESLMYNNNGTYDPSVIPSLMTDDSMPMMFDGDFSFTDSSESGSIDLSPFFTSNNNQSNTSSSSTQQGVKPVKSNMKGSGLKQNTKKSVSIKIETTTSAVKDSSVSSNDSSESSEERSPLTPNRNIIPPHLMNNRSDFSLYRQQQKYNTKVYKI